jgi:transcriptional regulator with XRE-family HTH domain
LTHFGALVKRLRKDRGLTLENVASKIGSHKGYVSGIESGKVNPPSVKLIRKFAKLFGQDERRLVLLAWVDKAPEIIKPVVEPLIASPEGRPTTLTPVVDAIARPTGVSQAT